jgi:hypothetical protein
VDDELYDAATIAALDRYRRAPRPIPAEVARGWRRGVGGAAILTAAMVGLADAFEPDQGEAIVEEIDLGDLAWPDAPVLVDFVPGAPKLTRCRVRPWLF